VVDNPELQKKFSHFINAPKEKDPTVRFEVLRDQKIAANWK
jgi:nitrite reductase (NADH) large subunit